MILPVVAVRAAASSDVNKRAVKVRDEVLHKAEEQKVGVDQTF